MKKFFVFLEFLIMCVSLTGCSLIAPRKFTEKEVLQYVEKEAGGGDFSIVSSTTKNSDVFYRIKDEDYDFDFLVIDDLMCVNEYSLERERHFIDEYTHIFFENIVYEEDDSILTLGQNAISANSYGGIHYYEIEGEFETREELDEIYDRICYYKDKYDSMKDSKETVLPIVITYKSSKYNRIDFPYENICKLYANLKDSKEEIYDSLYKDYFVASLQFDLEGVEDMTSEDYDLLSTGKYEYQKKGVICKVDDSGKVLKNYGIYGDCTYTNVYKVLLEEGFDVEGDDTHYIVHTKDDTYEISYDFVEDTKKGSKLYDGYEFYYLVNGNKKYTTGGFIIYLYTFGIKIDKIK